MSVKCSELIRRIEEKFPVCLSEKYDNTGLIIGDTDGIIQRVLVALDITPEIVREAVELKADMIVSHHPLVFKPLKRIVRNDYTGAMILELVKAEINVYALHTNFDNAAGGMNDIIAQILELRDLEPLGSNLDIHLYKLAVFVPKTHRESVRAAMLDAGAGHIGNYSHCSFNLEGMGTFRPLKGSSPFIGTEGRDESVEEVRIETIVEEGNLGSVLSSMKVAHPYEEVAYDIYPLKNTIGNGTGRLGYLKDELTLGELCSIVKNKLNVPFLSVGGPLDRRVGRVAVVGGSGSDFIRDSVAKGADVLITGDLKHHEALDAVAEGLAVIDAGHYFTEAAALSQMCSMISTLSQVECVVTRHCTNQLKRI